MNFDQYYWQPYNYNFRQLYKEEEKKLKKTLGNKINIEHFFHILSLRIIGKYTLPLHMFAMGIGILIAYRDKINEFKTLLPVLVGLIIYLIVIFQLDQIQVTVM